MGGILVRSILLFERVLVTSLAYSWNLLSSNDPLLPPGYTDSRKFSPAFFKSSWRRNGVIKNFHFTLDPLAIPYYSSILLILKIAEFVSQPVTTYVKSKQFFMSPRASWLFISKCGDRTQKRTAVSNSLGKSRTAVNSTGMARIER